MEKCMNEFELKIWRLHPQGVRLIPAEKTLHGTAHPDGIKWCGPFTNANKYGFWVFPPIDLDIVWKGGAEFEYNILTPWGEEEVPFVKSMIKDDDESKEFLEEFGGRVKVSCGRVENNICQIWSGCVFQTPPGWCLLIRSPININMDAPYRIQEGILETDWLPYDIWINVAIQQQNVPIQLRKDQWPPLAQLIPVRKESYDKTWTIKDSAFNRDCQEGEELFKKWADYNYKKYVKRRHEMEKDSGTYFKERMRHSGKRLTEPEVERKVLEPPSQCPFVGKLPKATPKRLFTLKNE
jgi:hypothetical protein